MVQLGQVNTCVGTLLVTAPDALNTRLRSTEMTSVSQPPLFTFEKRCGRCDDIQPFESFHRSNRNAAGLAYFCKRCLNDMQREKYAKSGVMRERARFAHIRKTYGMTREQYEAMLEDQGGVCAVCGRLPSQVHDWSIDHDHQTGAVRGILCSTCNSGLGHFKDDPELCELAAAYLRQHQGDKHYKG